MNKRPQTILLSCLVCLFSLFMVPASAQFTVGARAGANLATEPVKDLYHVFLARPYVGVFAHYKLASPIAFQLGVNYSGEGANYKDLATDEKYQIRHAFVTIPLLVEYRFDFGGYIELGPQFGLLLSAKSKYNDEASVDSKKYYKGTDVSAGIGLGYDFKQESSLKGFGISARYMRGLTKINKVDIGDNQDIRSRVLSIGITYKLFVK
jgi:hypothetical protein